MQNTNTAVSVSALTNQIRNVLETDFTNISVQGEISNFKLHSSGHMYFSMKDDKAQLKCVMWRGRSINFKPLDGMKVIAKGSISVYPPQGNYQLDCFDLKQVGQGDLYAAYEQLKAKLLAAGYFEQSTKKILPKLPLSIGISTSPTGAAIQDIISTLKRRLPFTTVYFRPTLVQGDGSADDIANAISDLERTPSEVIIIGRGGGSIEDLWSFNTEKVADAIFNCRKPIISAVGHETDFTIADFVADLRAPTPTAGAELASPISIIDLNEFFDNSSKSLTRIVSNKVELYKSGILDRYSRFAKRRINEHLRRFSQVIDSSESTLSYYLTNKLSKNVDIINRLESHLKSLHPFSPFEKGFAALKYNGKYINNNESILGLDVIQIVRKNESVDVIIKKD